MLALPGRQISRQVFLRGTPFYWHALIDFSLTVKAATFIFISGRGSAISSAQKGKSGSIYNLVKN